MARKSTFFQQVNYASFHEDSNSERRALSLSHSDRVLCLTGSGARPLDLLLDGPAEIVAIDWNPAQSHLLELKISVIRNLDYQAGLTFLGFRPSTSRESVYAASLRGDLSVKAQSFWDGRRSSIRRGVFFDGRWERFLRRSSLLARWTRRSLVREVFAATDIANQQEIWHNKWDNRWWRGFLSLASNRLLVRYVLREPGLQFVPNDLSISEFLRRRFEQASASFLFRDSPWICALFKGRIDERGPLPEHLKPEKFESLRERLDRLTIVTAPLTDYLRDSIGPFDAFSLSDFSSYCDRISYEDIWADLLRRASSGARFCERRFLVNYTLPPSLQSALAIDHALAKQLDSEDRSVVYTFLVATLDEALDS